MRRGVSVGLVALVSVLVFSLVRPGVSSAVCDARPDSAIRVLTASIATLYNVFPIRIGGVTIVSASDLDDFVLVNSPVCVCLDPIPRVGITISLWEPIALIESVKDPWCFPSAGLYIPVNAVTPGTAIGSDGGDVSGGMPALNASKQTHVLIYPLFSTLNLFLDFVCLQKGHLDMALISEADPLWQNDLWAVLTFPESLLFAFPLAQLACIVDAVAATAGFPLDPLFWCMGGWNLTYPVSKHYSGATSEAEAAMSAAGRTIMLLHRYGFLFGSVGNQGLCGMFYMPIWRKSQYGVFPIYPLVYPLRVPIGRTGMLWESGLDVPGANFHNWVINIYRKRDCCAF